MKKILLFLSIALLFTSCAKQDDSDSFVKLEKEFYEKYNEITDVKSLFKQDFYQIISNTHTYSYDDKIQTIKNIKYKGNSNLVKKLDEFKIESNEFVYEIEVNKLIDKKLDENNTISTICNGNNFYKSIKNTVISTDYNNDYKENEVTFGTNEFLTAELLFDFDVTFFNLKKYDKIKLNDIYDLVKIGSRSLTLVKTEPLYYENVICGNQRIYTVYYFDKNLNIEGIKQTVDKVYDKNKYEVKKYNLENSSSFITLEKIKEFNIDVNREYQTKIEDKVLIIDLR